MSSDRILDLCNLSEEDTKLLNKIYKKYKTQYVNMLDRLSRRKTTIYWWATPLANKTVHFSDTLKKICISIIAIEKIRKNPKICEVHCDSIEIAETIKKHYMRRKLRFVISNQQRDVAIAGQCLEFGLKIRREIDQYKKITDVLKKKNFDSGLFEKNITLIDTYVRASEISADGYEEQYFKGILDYTEQEIYFLPQFFMNIRGGKEILVKKLLHNQKYRYMFKEQFLHMGDYWKLLLYPLYCIFFCLNRKRMNEIDVTKIINSDLIRGITNENSIEGLLKYFTVKRMKERGIKIEGVIGWYEGQASSNMLFLGYRRRYPRGKSVGYMGYAMDQNEFWLSPSEEQIRHKAVPEKMAVIAEYFKKYPRQFVSDVRTVVVPAFRFQEAHQCTDRDESDKRRILVALTFEKETSKKMLEWIKNLEDFWQRNDIYVYIKNHPCNKGLSLQQYGIRNLNCSYELIGGDFSQALNGVDVVLTAQSNAGYETALYGIPIIFLNFPGQLNINYMPGEWESNRYDVVYDVKSLEEKIIFFLNEKPGLIDFDNEEFHVRTSKETVARLFE